MSVDATLADRETRYGKFLDGARSWRAMQNVLEGQPGWGNLMQDQQYAATMIMMKLARAMNGQPDDTDNWHDIQGYAKLVEDRILGRGIYAPAAEPTSVDTAVGDVQSTECEEGYDQFGALARAAWRGPRG